MFDAVSVVCFSRLVDLPLVLSGESVSFQTEIVVRNLPESLIINQNFHNQSAIQVVSDLCRVGGGAPLCC